VVDPRRDVDAYLAMARDEGLRITEIFETHVRGGTVAWQRAGLPTER
jgi:rhodanese-related sulfurtransferase